MNIAARIANEYSGPAISSERQSAIDGWAPRDPDKSHIGLLIVNADDWGRDAHTTGRILDCALRETISSVSAMVFMSDSERAAGIAREHGIDAGLHLNLTTPFSAPHCPPGLVERQQELARYLLRHPIARAIFNPGLVRSFQYVVAAQIDEFRRLYGKEPDRIDGHHHMHLCANVLLGDLLPKGTLLRRYFSAEPGEKSVRNGLFRKLTRIAVAHRHRVVDFFFSLPPIESRRLGHIFTLSQQYVVEIETHPANIEEYQFLMTGEIFGWGADFPIARGFARLPSQPERRL
jgi:chitin disaccharide deacetylase